MWRYLKLISKCFLSLTLIVVIFTSDNQSTGSLGRLDQQALVDGLESEGVDDTNIGALLLECLIGGQSLVQSDTSTHHGHLVTVRLAHDLRRGAETEGKMVIIPYYSINCPPLYTM